MNDIETITDGKLTLVSECSVREFVNNANIYEMAQAYAFRNGPDMFYIGISQCAMSRVMGHLSMKDCPRWPDNGKFVDIINDNAPASLDWQLQFYKMIPCGLSRYCDIELSEGYSRSSLCGSCVRREESKVISRLNPLLNAAGKSGSSSVRGKYIDRSSRVINITFVQE